MLHLFSRTLLFWLGFFEVLAIQRGWRGLSWLGRTVARLLLLLSLATLLGSRARWGWRLASLVLAAPPALLLHVAASSLRNWVMNPLWHLRPGHYADRMITRLDIPMREGYLPALYIVPEAGTTAAICVLHGSGCDKTYYAWRLIDLLVARRVAVLLIDLDGHGENPRPQSFPAITEDVVVAVDWLRARHERVGVLGISLGGCIAARAVADGVAVDGVALLEAPPKLYYTRADMWREAVELARPYLLDLFCDCTPYHLLRAWQAAPIRATISTWDLIDALDLCGSLAKIRAPLLLVYGARDAIVKPEQAEEVRRAAPPQADFHLIPNTSHLALILAPKTLRVLDGWVATVLNQNGGADRLKGSQVAVKQTAPAPGAGGCVEP